MPKLFPIRLEVEEIALGTVLRKLHEMPGIAKLHLDLGHGGQGAGKQQLQQAAALKGESAEQRAVKLLMPGPVRISEISHQLGGGKSRAYGAMHQLKKKGIVQSLGHGMWQLTHKASAQLGAVKALPAPAKIKHGPGGRASPGAANIVLRTVLANGPLRPIEMSKRAGALGMSPKSISGVLDRAKRDGLIKKNGSGYELTARGQKIEIGAHHG